MNNSSQNKRFKYGFKLGIFLSLLAQLITFFDYFASEILTHRDWEIGFPFSIHSSWYNSLPDGKPILIIFVGNVIFAVLMSVLLGVAFKFKGELYKLSRHNAFIWGFSVGAIISMFVNLLSYVKSLHAYNTRPIKLSAGYYGGGFPLHFYEAHIGYPNHLNFHWTLFLFDILMAIIFSFILGLIFKFVWLKIASRKLK